VATHHVVTIKILVPIYVVVLVVVVVVNTGVDDVNLTDLKFVDEAVNHTTAGEFAGEGDAVANEWRTVESSSSTTIEFSVDRHGVNVEVREFQVGTYSRTTESLVAILHYIAIAE
jgi:hypothetical protein